MSEHTERFHANVEQARYWNEEAGPKWIRYEASMNARMSAITEELLRRVDARPGDRVLDIGCGGGATTQRLAEAVGADGYVHGIDISEPMLEAARTRCGGFRQVRFENADAQIHPFTAETFDLLVSRFGVMFFNDPYAAFANLSGALRSEGRLHFVCWAPVALNAWFTVPLGVAKRYLGDPEPTPPRAPGPLAFSERDYVQDILDKAGYRSVQVETFETTMASSESPEQQAELFLKLGPAARLIAAREPDAETMQALLDDLVTELRKHRSGEVVALGATVYYVSARR